MSMTSTATRILGVGLVSALALGGGGSSPVAPEARSASDGQHPGQFSVAYEVSAPATIVLPPSCDPAARCVVPYANATSQVSGDVAGTAVAAGSAVIGSSQATSTAHAVFTGTVAACGTGTYVVRYSIVYELADVTGGSPGTWEVVPGFGTGPRLPHGKRHVRPHAVQPRPVERQRLDRPAPLRDARAAVRRGTMGR